MKARVIQTLDGWSGGRLRFAQHGGRILDDPENRQLVEPLRFMSLYERELGSADYDDDQLWCFRNRIVRVTDQHTASPQEILIAVKHLVVKRERRFSDMQSDLERFASCENGASAPRQVLPESVRVFVWRRDQARCTRCGDNKDLEFDHIIPLSRGGSSTERNIQLLCKACNLAKGASI